MRASLLAQTESIYYILLLLGQNNLNRLFYRGPRYVEVRYIEVSLYTKGKKITKLTLLRLLQLTWLKEKSSITEQPVESQTIVAFCPHFLNK